MVKAIYSVLVCSLVLLGCASVPQSVADLTQPQRADDVISPPVPAVIARMPVLPAPQPVDHADAGLNPPRPVLSESLTVGLRTPGDPLAVDPPGAAASSAVTLATEIPAEAPIEADPAPPREPGRLHEPEPPYEPAPTQQQSNVPSDRLATAGSQAPDRQASSSTVTATGQSTMSSSQQTVSPAPETPSLPPRRTAESPYLPDTPEPARWDLSPSQVVTASRGAETVVRLEGRNWIFMGADLDDGSVVYRRRRNLDDATEIVLRPDESGRFRVFFQRQDLERGEVQRSVVALDVAPRETRTAVDEPGRISAAQRSATEQTIVPDAKTPDAGLDNETGMWTFGDGAVIERHTIEGIPDDPGEIAAAAQRAMGAGNRELAAALWRRNRDLPTRYGTVARRGLFELSVGGSGLLDAVEHVRAMLDYGELPAVGLLVSLTDRLTAAETTGDLVPILERVADKMNQAEGSDEVLFRLAGHLETDPLHRNLRRSLAIYRQITSEYPLSRHWEASRKRIEYLERHFFYLR
jgi:hypothetical protein